VSKSLLYASIAVTGTLLGFLHYKLKPAVNEQDLRNYAQAVSTRTEWQGHIAPDFALKTTDGEQFQLSESVGKKIIVLNFFATWCGLCRDEMPELNRYFDEHRSQSFLLVAIDADEKAGLVDQYIKDMKLDFPAGIDGGAIEKQYGVNTFPTTVLIGVDGKVQFYETGELANADVAFDNLLRQNRELMAAGRVISAADFRAQAQAEKALPTRQVQEENSGDTAPKLDERGKRIVARMDCPCGCDQKVQTCTCNTSTNIKNALANEKFQNKPDDEIIRELNKRFCVGGGT
jgi:thiol-disulfide isomerase/thioredoxin